MRRILPFLLLAISVTCLMGCQGGAEGPPGESSSIKWVVRYDATPGNDLIGNGDGPGSSTTAWQSTFAEKNTKYSLDPVRYHTLNSGDDSQLDCVDPETFSEFVTYFCDQNMFAGYDATVNSLLFSVNTPLHYPEMERPLGWSWHKSDLGPFAISFVFRQKIWDLEGLTTTEAKWRGIQVVVLHELGHARGLDIGDHTGHQGSNWQICAMTSPFSVDIALNTNGHHFCGKHLKIFHDCLPEIKPSYNSGDACADGPYP